MKILFAVHTYEPDHNGVQAVTKYIAEGLTKWHHVKVIVGVNAENYASEAYPVMEQINGVEIERIHAELRNNHRFEGDRERYYKAISDWQPDILICVCVQSWPYDWIIEKIDQIKCKKVLFTHGFSAYMETYPFGHDILGGHIHALKDHIYWKQYYKKSVAYFRKFDLVTYLAKSSSSYHFALRHHLTNGMILGNAVEEALFDNSSLDRVQPDCGTVFIYVANYDANKNHQMVLDAFYQADIRDSSRLILIGGHDNGFYQELIRKQKEMDQISGKWNVQILYGLQRNEIMKQLQNADVFVCASKHEEYPVMLCEAAAKGLAIISTDVGNADEFPEISLVHSVEEMAKQISLLDKDHALRIRKGTALRNFASANFHISDKVEAFNTVLENL